MRTAPQSTGSPGRRGESGRQAGEVAVAGVGRAGRASRPPEGASRPSVPPSLPRSAAGRGVRRRGAAALGEAERLKWRHRRDGGGGGRGGPGERARGRGWGGSTGEPGGAQPPGPVCGSGARRSLRPRTLWGPGRGHPTPALPLRFPSSALWHCAASQSLALVCFVVVVFLRGAF